jgi:hypothetical protein
MDRSNKMLFNFRLFYDLLSVTDLFYLNDIKVKFKYLNVCEIHMK